MYTCRFVSTQANQMVAPLHHTRVTADSSPLRSKTYATMNEESIKAAPIHNLQQHLCSTRIGSFLHNKRDGTYSSPGDVSTRCKLGSAWSYVTLLYLHAHPPTHKHAHTRTHKYIRQYTQACTSTRAQRHTYNHIDTQPKINTHRQGDTHTQKCTSAQLATLPKYVHTGGKTTQYKAMPNS